MDKFQLGFMRIEKDETLTFGDPCYFDEIAQHAHEICHTVTPKWNAEGDNYPVLLVTDDGRPHALVIASAPYEADMVAQSLINRTGWGQVVTFLGVDSGQIGMVTGSTLATWTEREGIANWNPPATDYDWACFTTLNSYIEAGLLPNRVTNPDASLQMRVGTAVASGTRWGDGQYPLVKFVMQGVVTAYAVVFGEDDNFIDDSDFDDDEEFASDYDGE